MNQISEVAFKECTCTMYVDGLIYQVTCSYVSCRIQASRELRACLGLCAKRMECSCVTPQASDTDAQELDVGID